jgi:hypothetical protein
MANDLLMLIKLDTDTTAFLSLVIGIVGVVLGLIGAVAATYAAFYSKRAATMNERAQVEESTPHLEPVINKVPSIDTPTHSLEEREGSQDQAQPVSISVEGEAMGEVPLELLLTMQDSSYRISRLERRSDAGKTLGSSPCKATDNPLIFKSILASEKVRQWRDAGESTSGGEVRSVLRVYLLTNGSGREIHRDMPVSIVEGLRSVGIATLVVRTIKGST